jgi:ribonuclease HI
MGIQAEWRDAKSPERLRKKKRRTNYHPPAHLAQEYITLLQDEIREDIVEEADPAQIEWYNPTFLVPKGRTGRYRKILDCRDLNLELLDTPFKMEGPQTVWDLMQPGDWGTSLDVHSAFNHVPVAADLRPYLAFEFQGRTFWYKSMPFGVKHAPRVFTILMRQTARAIRERWAARIVCYMDDLLLLFEAEETARVQTLEIASFMEQLGWTLSPEKCEFTPMQRINFLGWQWNTNGPAVAMTPARRTKTREELRRCMEEAIGRRATRVRELARLIGNLSFLRLQFPEASLHLKRLDSAKVIAVRRRGWETTCRANPSWLGEIRWWMRQVSQNTPRSMLEWPQLATLTTDASPHGWGAVLQRPEEEEGSHAFGYWNAEQRSFTSNRKELVAVMMALRAFRKELVGLQRTTVLVQSDNTTVVADLNSRVATRTLTRPLLQLFTAARRANLNLTAIHIPGVTNTTADRLSRMGSTREFYLKEAYLHKAMETLGLEPDLDPFSSSPFLTGVAALRFPRDALRANWTAKRLFIHPPVYLIGRTLAKLRREPAAAIVILPAWRTQPWMPALARLMTNKLELGTFDEVMETTSRFKQEGWRLPPGRVWAVTLGMRTMKGSASSEDCSSGKE